MCFRQKVKTQQQLNTKSNIKIPAGARNRSTLYMYLKQIFLYFNIKDNCLGNVWC